MFLFQVFADTQNSTAPVSEREANFNKSKNNLFHGATPIPKEAIDELRLNHTLRNRVANELYQNHLFVYHQWLQFWKQWVDTQHKESIRLPQIIHAQGVPILQFRDTGEDASTNSTVSSETDVSSGSVSQPDEEQMYPIYSDVDNEILFWMSEKKLNQYLNNSFRTPTTIMVNPNFQINTVISNSTNATNGVVFPDIHSNSSNDFVVIPSRMIAVVSNITNTTTYFVSPGQNASDSDAAISFFNSPTLTFNVVNNPDPPATEEPPITLSTLVTPVINVTETPEVTTQQTPQNITITPVTVNPINFTNPEQTAHPITVKPFSNQTDIDFTTPKPTTLPVTITPDPKQNRTVCPDDDSNCTDSTFVTGTPFTAIYTTDEPISPCTDTTCLNSTGNYTELGPSTDDSNWMLDAEDLIKSNCTGDDCDNGTIATNPGYIENNSSNPLGQISVDQLLNSSNFNNDDWILENDFFNVTDEGSGDVCYCDELEDYECDQYNATSENPNDNFTDLNRIFENKEDSERTSVDIAANVSQNHESIKSFFDLSKTEEDKFKKSLEPILEALESAGPDPVESENTPEQSTFHSFDHCPFDNTTHNSSLLEQIDPNIFSIAEANLDKPPHGDESPKAEHQNSTSHQQFKNVTFDDSDTLADDLDMFKERSTFLNPKNDTFFIKDRFSEYKPLVINQTDVATTESPEDLYRRHSKELIEMREIMKKLRLIGLNFLDMGHLMLNGNSKCSIVPKHQEESHKHKNTYPVETD